VCLKPRALLHIGTHKTGSTSLQQFLRDENERLVASVGARFPQGFVLPNNHVELHMLTMRAERDSVIRRTRPEWGDEGWSRAATRHVRRQASLESERLSVWSAEGLSFLRYDDEFERLTGLFDGVDIEIIVFVRNRADFLDSYKDTLVRLRIPFSKDPDSVAYVEPDTWLVDVEERIAMWRRTFGSARVTVLDYDAVVGREQSIIPAFAAKIGIAREALPELSGYYVNARQTPSSFG
jgi:hypothetical protein